ncbi:MAG: polysaccharide biosynthesis C-terminal domain-containing protein [Kofleriaceae bacterium]|nr:polysaccharide biosynthesis C-terminal domain-containing protein [Kofleriaceae bacterium]
MANASNESPEVDKSLKKDTLINLMGMLGQLSGPALLILIARVYGTDLLGVFLASLALLDVSISFLTSGFRDAALMFVARHSDSEDEDDDRQLYQSLANAMAWSLGFAVLIIAVVYWAAPHLGSKFESFSPQMLPMLKIMVVSMPLFAFARIVLAATQGLMIMKYEAIDATGRSLSLFVLALVLWPITESGTGLALAYVGSQVLSFLFALYVFWRQFLVAKLWHAVVRFRFHGPLLRFAIPQNLNMALNHFITNVDILMLAYMGISAPMVGFYGTAARIVRELRRIRMVFSGALSPRIVVLFQAGKISELSTLLSRTSGWIAVFAIPAILVTMAIHPFVLQLFDPEFIGNTGFVMVLLLLPYLDCSFGLAGNVITMTGHSRLSLYNSLAIGTVNVGINTILIPEYGLLGAAIASAIASLLMVALMLSELRYILKMPLQVAYIYKPHVAGLLAVGLGFVYQREFAFGQGTIAGQFVFCLVLLTLFAAAFLVVGGRFRRR